MSNTLESVCDHHDIWEEFRQFILNVAHARMDHGLGPETLASEELSRASRPDGKWDEDRIRSRISSHAAATTAPATGRPAKRRRDQRVLCSCTLRAAPPSPIFQRSFMSTAFATEMEDQTQDQHLAMRYDSARENSWQERAAASRERINMNEKKSAGRPRERRLVRCLKSPPSSTNKELGSLPPFLRPRDPFPRTPRHPRRSNVME